MRLLSLGFLRSLQTVNFLEQARQMERRFVVSSRKESLPGLAAGWEGWAPWFWGAPNGDAFSFAGAKGESDASES